MATVLFKKFQQNHVLGSKYNIALIKILVVMMSMVYVASGLQFSYIFESSGPGSDITLVTEGSWYNGSTPYYAESAVWLTPDPNLVQSKAAPNVGDLGRVVYTDPIPLLATSSFSTKFVFRIITNGTYSESGSGMAFFMSTSQQAPNYSIAGGLGLVYYQNNISEPLRKPEFPFFAVEFDTRISPAYKDPSASHIGIDINSLVSANLTDTSNSSSPFYPSLYLYLNQSFTCWVDYDASSHLIQVWMINNSSTAVSKPSVPCVQYQYNISDIFNGTPVYVGFSSTNRWDIIGQEGVAIYAWDLTIDNGATSHSAISTKLVIVIVVVGAACVIVLVLLILWWCCRRKQIEKKRHHFGTSRNSFESVRGMAGSTSPRFTYRLLKKASQGFSESNMIGEGGYSKVYKGTLPDGSVIAMKKMKDGLKGEAEFVGEIEIISCIRHRNLLQLQGWCYENGKAVLVYQYMAQGSLDSYIFGRKRGMLDSKTRLRILSGVAAALEYLHGGLGECVLHRDVKAANVLLTDDLEPVLGDFGLARLITHDQVVTLTTAGTPGYVAPEVAYAGRGTSKADVYSYGVLTLEVVCGRSATDSTLPSPNRRLLDWVWSFQQIDKLQDVLDPAIVSSVSSDDELHLWMCVLHVALMCCHPSPESRPTMRQVSQVLQDAILLPLPLSKPTFPRSPDLVDELPESFKDSSYTVTPKSIKSVQFSSSSLMSSEGHIP